MGKLIPIKSRKPYHACWFCRSKENVIYTGQIPNPCPYDNNRYIDILLCKKCNKRHSTYLREYWDNKIKNAESTDWVRKGLSDEEVEKIILNAQKNARERIEADNK